MRNLKIYTSYFAQLDRLLEDDVYPVSIARISPKFFIDAYGFPEWKSVAHSKDILFQIMKSAHTDKAKEIYKERYLKEVLGQYESPLWLMEELYRLVPDECDKCVLLCYEKPSDFCHRHLLADYLNKHIPGLEISEYTRSEESGDNTVSYNALF